MKLKDVLLALVELHPDVTGYELKAIIAESTGYFISASFSQIYPGLRALTDEGSVTFRVEEAEGRPDRKMYRITDLGRDRLTEVLDRGEPLPTSMSAFRDFLLHVTFLGHLEPDRARVYVRTQLAHFRSERRRIAEENLGMERRFLHVEGEVRERYLHLWEAEHRFLVADLDRKIAWIDELLEQL